jgi:hypothetical protein
MVRKIRRNIIKRRLTKRRLTKRRLAKRRLTKRRLTKRRLTKRKKMNTKNTKYTKIQGGGGPGFRMPTRTLSQQARVDADRIEMVRRGRAEQHQEVKDKRETLKYYSKMKEYQGKASSDWFEIKPPKGWSRNVIQEGKQVNSPFGDVYLCDNINVGCTNFRFVPTKIDNDWLADWLPVAGWWKASSTPFRAVDARSTGAVWRAKEWLTTGTWPALPERSDRDPSELAHAHSYNPFDYKIWWLGQTDNECPTVSESQNYAHIYTIGNTTIHLHPRLHKSLFRRRCMCVECESKVNGKK